MASDLLVDFGVYRVRVEVKTLGEKAPVVSLPSESLYDFLYEVFPMYRFLAFNLHPFKLINDGLLDLIHSSFARLIDEPVGLVPDGLIGDRVLQIDHIAYNTQLTKALSRSMYAFKRLRFLPMVPVIKYFQSNHTTYFKNTMALWNQYMYS